MQKINFSKQTIIFLAVILCLVIEVVVFFPWGVGTLFRLNREVEKSANNIYQVKSNWALKESYLSNRDNIKGEISKIRAKIISSQEDSKVFSFISASSKDFQVNIYSLSPEKLQDYALTNSGDFKYLPIQIKAESGFHNLLGFLNYLQKSKYLFGVNELQITSRYPFNVVNMTVCCLIEKK